MDIEQYKEMMPRFNAVRELVVSPYEDDLDMKQVTERCKRIGDELPATIAWFRERGVELGAPAERYMRSCQWIVDNPRGETDPNMVLFEDAYSSRQTFEIAAFRAELDITRRLLGIEA